MGEHGPMRIGELSAQSGSDGPRLDEVERNKASNPLKIPFVVGHEKAAGFAAREREQDVIRERFRDASDFQSFLSRHCRKQIAGPVPGIGRRRDCSVHPQPPVFIGMKRSET
jgi:hypothetical protein